LFLAGNGYYVKVSRRAIADIDRYASDTRVIGVYKNTTSRVTGSSIRNRRAGSYNDVATVVRGDNARSIMNCVSL
tara:strand:- start:370 stop:594 length:225 start_codon:yes stop_codon:yes gene_type:complete